MELYARLDALLTLAGEIGVEVRREPMGGESGGVCVMRGRRVLFVDTAADLETRYEKTLAGLARLPELQNRFLPPEVRDDLDRVIREAGA